MIRFPYSGRPGGRLSVFMEHEKYFGSAGGNVSGKWGANFVA